MSAYGMRASFKKKECKPTSEMEVRVDLDSFVSVEREENMVRVTEAYPASTLLELAPGAWKLKGEGRTAVVPESGVPQEIVNAYERAYRGSEGEIEIMNLEDGSVGRIVVDFDDGRDVISFREGDAYSEVDSEVGTLNFYTLETGLIEDEGYTAVVTLHYDRDTKGVVEVYLEPISRKGTPPPKGRQWYESDEEDQGGDDDDYDDEDI
jgi:hypothetical protein